MKHVIDIICNILNAAFPHKDPDPHLTPFVSQTWLEKAMMPTHIIDHLWTPSKEQ
jgi:hypothetical protein